MALDNLFAKLDKLDEKRLQIVSNISKLNAPWHLNRADTYLSILPKDIFNIVYLMFPGSYVTKYDAQGHDYKFDYFCLQCGHLNNIIKAYMISHVSIVTHFCMDCRNLSRMKRVADELWAPVLIDCVMEVSSGKKHETSTYFFQCNQGSHLSSQDRGHSLNKIVFKEGAEIFECDDLRCDGNCNSCKESDF